MNKHAVVSLFSGCGGLDLGFAQSGLDIIWANDCDNTVWRTYEYNHPNTKLDKRSISDIPSEEIPDADGIIGGPPCQSWSLAGAMRGERDPRGQLFYEYIRVLRNKKPLFFLAENVPGIISKAHKAAFEKLLNEFYKIGYNVNYKLINAKYYGVPQERLRVIVVGYSEAVGKYFTFPEATHLENEMIKKNLFNESLGYQQLRTLKDAIGDLPEPAPARDKNKANGGSLHIANHEYMNGGFSTIYMSRNRRKGWGEPSFTIQAGGRHAPLFPGTNNRMIKVGEDKWEFDKSATYPYRRLSIRECARIQTFPDNFIFYYDSLADGYKMVGNAVPILLAQALADTIRKDLSSLKPAVHMTESMPKQL